MQPILLGPLGQPQFGLRLHNVYFFVPSFIQARQQDWGAIGILHYIHISVIRTSMKFCSIVVWTWL